MRDMNRFELERAITNWKSPFSVRHFYSGDDARELEWHLRDAFADEMAAGLLISVPLGQLFARRDVRVPPVERLLELEAGA